MTPQQHAHLPRPVHKEPPAHAPNAALLIDFDNVTMGIRSDLQSELKRLLQSEVIRGKVAVQRAYADWRRYPQYIVPLSESSIDLIFAPAYGSDRKSTRLNSSHSQISYAVFCLKKKKKKTTQIDSSLGNREKNTENDLQPPQNRLHQRIPHA